MQKILKFFIDWEIYKYINLFKPHKLFLELYNIDLHFLNQKIK